MSERSDLGDHGASGVAVSVRELSHSYGSGRGPLDVLDRVDMDVSSGDYIALTGPSGSGKSTLLSIIGGLQRPAAGTVVVGDEEITELSGDGLACYRRETVGFVFQHFGLLETLSAQENVELACALARMAPGQRQRDARRLLSAVGLAARATHRPGALSGGERQRVAIARALANRPSLVLADEPTGNLDEESALKVIRLLETLHERWGYTIIVVTHNRAIARRAAARLVLAERRLTTS